MTPKDNKRALKVIRSLHTTHKKQSEQIGMLCHDMVSAHRDFSTKLSTLNFVVPFYEKLLRCTCLEELLEAAVKGIHEAVPQADAAVFLLSKNGFDVHVADAGIHEPVEKQEFKHWFTRELVNTISQMNHVCSLEQLLHMGLQGPPAILKTISLSAVPLGRMGQAIGFMLVYRRADLPLQAEEMSRLAAVSIGLREAILGFQKSRTQPSTKQLHV